MKSFNHILYDTTKEEVDKTFRKCRGCEDYPIGFRHTCRFYAELDNDGSWEPYCTKIRKEERVG